MPPLKGDPSQHNPKALGDTITGTCLCGSIQVTLNDSYLLSKRHANGRKISESSSSVAANLSIEESKTHIDDRHRTLNKYADLDTMSGRQVDRYFCSSCGCPILSMTALLPGRVIINMGIFPRIPVSKPETSALHRRSWQRRQEGIV
ncbi:uncharacterized protein BDV17DRAFT_191785 [Aspergillus undulatus]|uniref:uncharacterized protein n=1 Tax=Aspergillus undulatus TaxID=1810928 RepID=UPI003CCDF23F